MMERFFKEENIHNSKNNGNKCTNDWTTFKNPKDGHLYGYKVVVQDMINCFQAERICRSMGAEVVSIHSSEENSFVAKLASSQLEECQNNPLVCAQRVPHTNSADEFLDKILRGFYIGLHRSQFNPSYSSAVVHVWSDGSPCDYGCYDGVVTCDMHIDPWGPCNPSGTNNSFGNGYPEDCTEIYLATPSGMAKWNDISSYHKLGGVICKKSCEEEHNHNICGKDGWPYVGEKEYHAFPLTEPGNYWQAHSICQKQGAQVASIHSQGENDITSALAIGQAGGNLSACSWIGLHSSHGGSKTGFWDDGSNADFGMNVQPGTSPWSEDKNPSIDKDKESQHCQNSCTAIFGNGRWKDLNCDDSCGAVICEKECKNQE
uniref:C-type lectin domain-containing protein n=1 Tax=Meloidogyne hapla TaxID=6305 RepID=A0A1I8B5T4_MELHA